MNSCPVMRNLGQNAVHADAQQFGIAKAMMIDIDRIPDRPDAPRLPSVLNDSMLCHDGNAFFAGIRLCHVHAATQAASRLSGVPQFSAHRIPISKKNGLCGNRIGSKRSAITSCSFAFNRDAGIDGFACS